MCNLNQTPFMNMGVLSDHSTACLSRMEGLCFLLAGDLILAIIFQKSFRSKKVWRVGLCFVSWLPIMLRSYQIFNRFLLNSTKLRS